MPASVQKRGQLLRVILGLWLLAGGAAEAVTFTNVGTNLTGLSQGWIAWGDYDNDGRLDLIAAGTDGGWNNQTLLCSNAGNGTFVLVSNTLPAVAYTMATWGDYDNDGRLDLLIGGGIYHNDGNGVLALAFTIPDANGSPTVWGDFNNDGRLDVVATDADGRTMVYWNTGTNFVGSGQGLFVALNIYSSISVADFDNDGWLDLLLCDFFGTYLFRNVGDGSFEYLGSILPGIKVGGAPLADFDGDGKVDLFLHGQGQATLYRNTGTNAFVSAGNPLSSLSASAAAWGDYDGDGRPDLWAAGSPTNAPAVTRLFRNTPAGFVNSGIALPWMYWPAVAWGDFNNDGTLDVACFGWGASGPESHIYRNDGTPSNAPPIAPTGLTAVQSNDLVIVSWQAASDPNQTNSLTYNIRIGTTPGGINVLSPMANPLTGRRLLPERGNAGERLFAIFNLSKGTNYYWNVQAIDNGFAGGAFAAENSFYLDLAPVISAIPDQTIQFSTSTPPLPFTIGDFETLPDQLLLSATSGNTNLLPVAGIVFDRAGSNCTVTLTPTPLNVGTSLVTLVVTDPQGRTASNSFVLNVTNAAPTISQSPNVRLRPNAVVPPVTFEIGDAETPAAELAVTWTFSNSNLVQSSMVTGTDSNRVLSLTLKPDQRGKCLVSLVVHDPVGATATNAFTLEAADLDLQTNGLPNVMQGGVEWGDFDHDGRLDVLIWGNLPGVGAICRIYRNDGSQFTNTGAAFPGISDGIARWGDYDNDGYLDVLIAGIAAQSVYHNNHDGTFTNINATIGTGRGVTGGWVDYNNDGRLDIFLSSSTGTHLYRNNGDGTFTEAGVVFPATFGGSAAWGDYDGDGDLDLALGGITQNQGKDSPTTAIYRNDGNGLFTPIGFFAQTNLNLQGVGNGSLAWGDYDQDGQLDLLLTGINGNYYITRLYRNSGDDIFSLGPTNLVNVETSTGVWGDFDNDGHPDIFLAGFVGGPAARVAVIYRNDGAGGFANIGEPLPGASYSAAAWGDFDGDSILDLLYCGTTNGSGSGAGTFLYRNAGTRTNTPPMAPTGLTLLPNQILSWNPGGDLETTNPAGLTYNLRIGTTPGGSDVLVPDADPATGQRRVARPGNVGPAARWRADLPYGTYYWSVQTIDTAFAGSPFATESSFTVTNLRPTLSAVTNRLISLNTSTAPIPIIVGDFESAPEALVLTGSSADTNLVPESNLVFSGSGSNRTLVVTPAPDLTGNVKLTVTVTDPGGLSSSTAFVLTVTNYPPSISNIPDQHTPLATPTPPIPFIVSDPETPAGSLALSASSSNTNLLPVANIVFGGSGSNRTVTLTPLGPDPGVATVLVTVTDPNGRTATDSLLFTVERFSLAATNLIPTDRGGLAWGDYDSDGWLDLAIAGEHSTILDAATYLYRNQSGVLLPAITNNDGTWVDGKTTWEDYNRDGWLDLGIMGRNAGVMAYPNNHAGGFGSYRYLGILAHTGSMAFGDADSDGMPDLLITGATGVGGVSVADIYRYDGSFFWAVGAGFTPVSGGSGTFADFDEDGDLDVLLTGLPVGSTNGITRLYRNDGNLTFTPLPQVLPGLYNSSAAWADFDNDGWPDFVICGTTGSTNLTLLFRNNGDGTFAQQTNTGLPGVQLGSIAWGDYDNDGFPDLLLTGTTNGAASGAIAAIYRNNHDGTFTDIQAALPGVYSGNAAWGDFDNDGDLDVALLGTTTSSGLLTRVYRNNTLTVHTPPSVPAGLIASLSNGQVTFAWSPPLGQTTTNGLAYNLRVGLTPGGNEIIPSQSAANGWRRMPAAGNAGQATLHRLINAAPGTYYWSVQSVDAALAGSAFAPEQIFSFTNFPPVAARWSVTTPEDSGLVLLPATLTNASGQTFTFTLLTGPSHGTISNTLNGAFFYRPDTNFFGNDAFQYQVSVGGTNLPPALAVITVTPVPDVSPVLLAMRPLAGGQFELRLTGEPYQDYELQVSADLAAWSMLTRLQTPPSGVILLTNTFGVAPCFFRAQAVDSIPPTLIAPGLAAAGGFQFILSGTTPGRTNIILSSFDLLNWSALSTNLAVSNRITVLDPVAPAVPRRFYRAFEIP